jgi:hypothetical protein
MAAERVLEQTVLEPMLDNLRTALDCGNRAFVRKRLAEFIADEHLEGPSNLITVPPKVIATDG